MQMYQALLFSLCLISAILLLILKSPIITDWNWIRKPALRYADRVTGKENVDDSVALRLYNEVRVICWINTWRENLDTKATAIRETWGKRCNTLVFIGDRTNDSFPIIGFNTPEGHSKMVPRIFMAFDYVYENHREDGDWFMRSDDDAYVIMENLRYLLSSYNPKDKWYIGRAYSRRTSQGFNSGGGGIVLSKAALKTLYERPSDKCKNRFKEQGADDAELGQCLFELGVKIADTRDKLNKSRFHPYSPFRHIRGTYCLNHGRNIMRYNCPSGIESFSEYLISFHHLPPAEMFTFEMLLYRTRPYGISHGLNDINIHDLIVANKTISAGEYAIEPAH